MTINWCTQQLRKVINRQVQKQSMSKIQGQSHINAFKHKAISNTKMHYIICNNVGQQYGGSIHGYKVQCKNRDDSSNSNNYAIKIAKGACHANCLPLSCDFTLQTKSNWKQRSNKISETRWLLTIRFPKWQKRRLKHYLLSCVDVLGVKWL